MGMPEGYSVRPPTLEDVPAIAAILLADDLVSTGQSDYDEDFVRDQWATPGFDPSLDSWVVDGPNGVVASAHVMPGDPSPLRSWGVVHRDHRRRGIGSALIDRIEARAIERMDGIAEAKLHHSITDADEAARAMLVKRGYAFARSFRHMQIDLVRPTDPGSPPSGVEVRGIDPRRDLRAIHRVLSEAFEEEWSYDVPSFEAWRAREIEAPATDTSLWLAADAAGEIVGALAAWIWGDRLWIGEFGVARSWRRRGVGSALLRRSFANAAERGVPRVMLNVDFENPTGAMALYESLGMRPVSGFDVYEKPLT